MIPIEEEERLLDGVRKAVLEASAKVAEIFKSKQFDVSSKGAAGPLTTADLAANEILETHLRALLPEAGWLSEESIDSKDRVGKKFLWVVDPIDGTREFVDGTGGFSVSAGLSVDGIPFLAAVAMPAENRIVYSSMYVGVLAETIPGGIPTRPLISQRKELIGSRILVSETENRKGTFDSLKNDFEIKPTGSFAIKLALLAAGEEDLVISLYPKNDWDICGGTALVLAHPDAEVIELETGVRRAYNSGDTMSYGLAAGNSSLVKQFATYFKEKNLKLRRSYS